MEATEQVVDVDRIFEEKRLALEKMYPSHVVVIKKGDHLYHQSRDAEQLVREGVFKADKTYNQGHVFLTDKPDSKFTNIQVELQQPALLFDLSNTSLEQRIEYFGKKGWYQPAMKEGFQGFRDYSGSMYVPVGAMEIQIFPEGVNTLNGGIKPYRGTN